MPVRFMRAMSRDWLGRPRIDQGNSRTRPGKSRRPSRDAHGTHAPLLAIVRAATARQGLHMLSRVRCGALRGIDAILVDVEVDVSPGLPQTTTVGLPDGAVR